MIDDLNIIFLDGGHNRVDSSWEKKASRIDKCYKIYLPVEGSSNVVLKGRDYKIEAGNVYFLSGWVLDKQYCSDSMDVYWVHCNPQSLHLLYFLASIEPFHCWPSTVNPFGTRINEAIEILFGNRKTNGGDGQYAAAALKCEINALILHLIATLVSEAKGTIDPEREQVLAKIMPAIEYINANIYNKINLNEISSECDLAPNYFHRIFKQVFRLTPLQYIMGRRLSHAQHLLATTNLTVYDIAHQVGYDNEFYFSRIFKGQLGLAPSDYRKSNKHL